jgi:hypothetical protein
MVREEGNEVPEALVVVPLLEATVTAPPPDKFTEPPLKVKL